MKTRKFNILDVLIIVVIAGIIAGIVMRGEIRQLFFSDENASFMIDVKIDGLENTRAATITDGTVIYDANGDVFGTVSTVSKTPSVEQIITDGVEKNAQSTRWSDVTVTITVPGYISGGAYYANRGAALLVDDMLRLETDALSLDCKVTDVKKVNLTAE